MDRSWLKHVLTVLLVLVATMFVPDTVLPAGARESRQYRREFSFGFREDPHVYFLLEYKVFRRRRPIWFIMPIERSPVYYDHRIFLYRYDTAEGRLEQLGLVRDEIPTQTNIKSSLFTRENGLVIFAYQAGWSRDQGLLYELRGWDTARDRFADPGVEGGVRVSRESPAMQKYFRDYVSPWWDNPGVITITELKTEVLKDVSEEDWGLP